MTCGAALALTRTLGPGNVSSKRVLCLLGTSHYDDYDDESGEDFLRAAFAPTESFWFMHNSLFPLVPIPIEPVFPFPTIPSSELK